ncbi:MAG: HpsJ family protein [Nostocaceae cyanobacterium]|nr:HpsJ family protein [Nostocaceae cyanobacterium]
MNQLENNQYIRLVEEFQEFGFTLLRSISVLRFLGYCLLVLALFDVVEMFVPPNFMNPAWEFQTIGGLVERVPVTLIGLGLVFYGENYSRSKWELPFLNFLSWLILLLGILFILFIPLGISNTIRLNHQIAVQVNNQYTQQMSRAEQMEKQLNQATPEQINQILKSQGGSSDSQKPEELKSEFADKLSQGKEQLKTQAAATKSAQSLNLLKKSVKWNLGALISATFFITIWKATIWARKM